jgi:hypothetical protein
LEDSCPINKERGSLVAKPLKNLEDKIRTQEATDSFKKYQRFIFLFGSTIYTSRSSSQSRETAPLSESLGCTPGERRRN